MLPCFSGLCPDIWAGKSRGQGLCDMHLIFPALQDAAASKRPLIAFKAGEPFDPPLLTSRLESKANDLTTTPQQSAQPLFPPFSQDRCHSVKEGLFLAGELPHLMTVNVNLTQNRGAMTDKDNKL